jgi:putative chitinase
MFNIDIDTFFEKIQPFFGSPLTPGQELNMKVLLTLGATEVNGLEAMAYVLATVLHEAGHAMAPRPEIGEGHGHPYGKKVDKVQGKLVPYTTPNKLYYGRGHVQLTWRSNYIALGNLVEEDLLNHPDLMLSVTVSAHVAIKGMTRGSFTGNKLADYFGPGMTPNPIHARRIINGEDDALQIAKYYTHFLAALQAAHQTAVPPAPQMSVVGGTPPQVVPRTSAANALAIPLPAVAFANPASPMHPTAPTPAVASPPQGGILAAPLQAIQQELPKLLLTVAGGVPVAAALHTMVVMPIESIKMGLKQLFPTSQHGYLLHGLVIVGCYVARLVAANVAQRIQASTAPNAG